jgi:hypothetical protein
MGRTSDRGTEIQRAADLYDRTDVPRVNPDTVGVRSCRVDGTNRGSGRYALD